MPNLFSSLFRLTGLACAVLVCGLATAPAVWATEAEDPEELELEAVTINWDDLLPDGEMQRIEELYRTAYGMGEIDHFGAQMTQIGTFNVVTSLLDTSIRMPGFILPLDAQPGGVISEFLLVPYFGACIHTPPPPPNQIVHVVTEEPIMVERLWAPVWVEGRLTSERNMNELGNAAYTLHLTAHEPYEY